MTLATVLCFSLLCLSVCAAAEGDAPFACNIKAISAAERPRYNDLVKRLRIAITDRSELSDGYAYKLDTKKITLPEVAEWITMERLCCPFLAFQPPGIATIYRSWANKKMHAERSLPQKVC